MLISGASKQISRNLFRSSRNQHGLRVSLIFTDFNPNQIIVDENRPYLTINEVGKRPLLPEPYSLDPDWSKISMILQIKSFFSIVLDAKVSIVTVSKLVDVAVTGNCKC